MTVGEGALFAGLTLNAGAVVYAAWIMHKTRQEVHQVHKETNSMRAALEKAEFAKGLLAGKLETNESETKES